MDRACQPVGLITILIDHDQVYILEPIEITPGIRSKKDHELGLNLFSVYDLFYRSSKQGELLMMLLCF